ncbi:MAG TPA: UDP-N-acetylmuramoyl-tripeptide--D-alanyl-D-alanine ligase [Burkholderiales bacterium]|nr:UDP-N-acetylmuramoyl-tripeptide--D-alanyl-D-alanine ligase [Burkholderiales bacterium]
MMRLSEAARAISAELRGEDRVFESVSTDTRALAPGALFVALKGGRYDGHEFLAQAAAAGAAAALVEAARSAAGAAAPALPLLLVENTRRALGSLAACWRRRFALPLVALTGSNGKTTVKEMLAGILRAAASSEAVLATRGNLNNDIGVPLTLLELRARHRYAVIEIGMNHAGEVRELSGLAAPSVALVTNAGPAHLEFFGTVQAIARAKGEIFEALAPEGVAVINADDEYAPLWRDLARGRRIVEFGLARPAAVSASYRLRPLASEIVLRTPAGEAQAALQAPGLHNVRNALAAAAAAVALEAPLSAIAAGLARYQGVKGRLQRKAGPQGAVLLDDTYNANPESARAAIEVLARMPGRKLLVLGDMGELGPEAPALHAAVGRHAREHGVERLYALGEHAAHAARAFGAGGRHFESLEALLAALESELAPGVTVLVKGSRFMRMERVVAALSGDGEQSGERREEIHP